MPLTDRDKRTLKIGGIVAGVLIVGVLLMQVLGGGGDDDVVIPSGTPTTSPTGSGSPTPTLTTSPTPAPTPVGVFTGRDPFSIPGVFGAGTTTTTSGTTTTTSGTTTTTTSPGTSTSTSSGPPPTQPGNGSSITVGGHEVVLLDVFVVNGVDTVQVEVDGAISNASEGESFGPGDQFEVRSISGNCASFLYGDESFTLCVTPQK
jgi:hypothetical protein